MADRLDNVVIGTLAVTAAQDILVDDPGRLPFHSHEGVIAVETSQAANTLIICAICRVCSVGNPSGRVTITVWYSRLPLRYTIVPDGSRSNTPR